MTTDEHYNEVKEMVDALRSQVEDLREEVRKVTDNQEDTNPEGDWSWHDELREGLHRMKADLKEAQREMRGARREVRKEVRHSRHRSHPRTGIHLKIDDFDFGLGPMTAGFEGIGDLISGLMEGFSGIFNEAFTQTWSTPRSRQRVERRKVVPGTDIVVRSGADVEPSYLDLEGIPHAESILKLLDQELVSGQELADKLGTEESSLTPTLEQLINSRYIIQEKVGKKRFMLTRLGRKAVPNKADEEDN